MATATKIAIPPIGVGEAVVRVEGITPFLSNNFSDEKREAMLAVQTGKATGTRKKRDPEADFRESLYVVAGKEDAPDSPGKFFIPARAFKRCLVEAAKSLKRREIPATRVNGWLFVENPDPLIEFDQLVQRADVARNANGGADIRFRGEFQNWKSSVRVTFDSDKVSIEQLLELFQRGGWSIGVGGYRPEFGRFTVTGAEVVS